VVKAVDYANAQGVPTIAFVGFKGGRLKERARHVVHVDSDNYGFVEDAHMSLIHVLTQYITARKKG
jgi:D-sedoheptulose 7-phosphate isomerase